MFAVRHVQGRIGAGTYLLTMSVTALLRSVSTIFLCEKFADAGQLTRDELSLLVSFFGGLVGLVFYPLSAGRLRDLNFPGWSVSVLAFPLIGVMVLPVLCFLSGSRWDNEYGSALVASGFLKVTAAVVLCFVAILVSYEALTAFLDARHRLR